MSAILSRLYQACSPHLSTHSEWTASAPVSPRTARLAIETRERDLCHFADIAVLTYRELALGLWPEAANPKYGPGIILETNDPERVWNAFRLANTALEEGHSVETFLLGDGVDAPDLDHEKFNPHGVMRKYTNLDGALFACGTCLESRDFEPDELRPHATMGDCLRIVEDADKTLTIG